MANLYPSPTPRPYQGWESGTFWLLCGFILDLGGKGFAVAVVLSKIVGTLETKSLNNVDETFSMGFSRKSILFVHCVK